MASFAQKYMKSQERQRELEQKRIVAARPVQLAPDVWTYETKDKRGQWKRGGVKFNDKAAAQRYCDGAIGRVS